VVACDQICLAPRWEINGARRRCNRWSGLTSCGSADERVEGARQQFDQQRGLDRLDQVMIESRLARAAAIFLLAISGHGNQTRRTAADRLCAATA
jgi:hypothetical protein